MAQAERRRWWMAVHRYSGLAMLGFLMIAAITGIVLSFDKPIDAWLNPELFACPTAPVIHPALAATRLEHAHPELAAVYFPVSAGAGDNIAVLVEPIGSRRLGFDQMFLSCVDGHVVGTRRTAPGWDRAHLLRGIYLFHYTLLAGDAGRWLMGAVAATWLLGNLVGIYLTWPLKAPWLRNWKRLWQVRASSPLPRLLLDLHRASGLWLLPMLSVLAFTSVCMNFFSEAFVPAVAALSPPHVSPLDRPTTRASGPPLDFGVLRLKAEAVARRAAPGWAAAVYQREPAHGLSAVRFTRSGVETYDGLGPITIWFYDATGRLAAVDDPYADSAGAGLTRALYPLHTGKMIGWLGVAVDVVLGLTVIEQCLTGVYLWWKRRPARVARPARAGAVQKIKRDPG